MDTLKQPAFVLSSANSIAIISYAVWQYRQSQVQQAEIKELSSLLKMTIQEFGKLKIQVDNQHSLLEKLKTDAEQKTRDIRDLSSYSQDDRNSIEYIEDEVDSIKAIMEDNGMKVESSNRKQKSKKGKSSGRSSARNEKSNRNDRSVAFDENHNGSSNGEEDLDIDKAIHAVRSRKGRS
jgi:hypothetical protein